MTGPLKPIAIIPPVVALVLAVLWIGGQRRSISTFETENALLQKHIAAARAAPEAGPSHGKPAPPAKTAKDKEPLDWKKIAAQLAVMQGNGGLGDMRAMLRFQQRLRAMTREELVAAVDEIATLDLSAEERRTFEPALMEAFVQKDPALALTQFVDRVQNSSGALTWQLSNALQQWAKKDPAKAAAWFDQQIAAGKFDSKALDGRSNSRKRFEASMIEVLLGSDLTAASRRLGAMPENQRSEVLELYSLQKLPQENQLAFATLVREQLAADAQARSLGKLASQQANADGYTKVTEFLNRIDATPAERAACAGSAVHSKLQQLSRNKKIAREDIDTMREWITSQSPESTDKLTGSVLANSTLRNHKLEFSEAAALATRYHEASGSDDVLEGFLNGVLTNGGTITSHKEEARFLAGKISDPKRRDEILSMLK